MSDKKMADNARLDAALAAFFDECIDINQRKHMYALRDAYRCFAKLRGYPPTISPVARAVELGLLPAKCAIKHSARVASSATPVKIYCGVGIKAKAPIFWSSKKKEFVARAKVTETVDE